MIEKVRRQSLLKVLKKEKKEKKNSTSEKRYK